MEGTYEKSNPEMLQSFLIDLVMNLNKCSKLGIDEINIDFLGLKGDAETELKSIIDSVARHFNLRVVC